MSKREPLVSVAIITYNHAAWIARAMNGVLKQKTRFPFELVIGEDCSTDGTREIVREYATRYPEIIRVVASESNVGAFHNAVRTRKACRGTYLAFCEGDDYWHREDKLEKQVDYLERHPECGLVYSSYDVDDARNGTKIEDFIRYKDWTMPEAPSVSDFIEARGAMFWGIMTCTAIVRRALCEEIIAADPNLHQNPRFLRSDTQLWAEMAARAGVHFIPESLSTYTLTEESTTRSRDFTRSPRLQIADAELNLYLCEKYNLPPHVRDEMTSMLCNGKLRLAFHERSPELAEEARRMKKSLAFKEWLLYQGAKSGSLYEVLRLAVLVRNKYRKAPNEWL
jgi:glycosyltransferase involved in cell wall biosynthesis